MTTTTNSVPQSDTTVAFSDQPGISISDANIFRDVGIAELGGIDIHPDRDLLILKNDHDTYDVIDVPADTDFTGIAPNISATV